jgi:hypothetical protein
LSSRTSRIRPDQSRRLKPRRLGVLAA